MKEINPDSNIMDGHESSYFWLNTSQEISTTKQKDQSVQPRWLNFKDGNLLQDMAGLRVKEHK